MTVEPDTEPGLMGEPRGPRYQPVCELARGGMAVLSVAVSTGAHGFEKYVVLKRISPQFAQDDEFVQMFLSEARHAAKLDHPHIAHVTDMGQDADGLFYVMEYIHGEDLRSLARTLRPQRDPIPLRHVLTIGIAAAAALHHAHTRKGSDGSPLGLVHRDVSPTNILVSYEGAVKLVDFGIAKAASDRGSTGPSVRKGKISYLSPEQCKGAPLDHRSDVFSLGIVLHELLTGGQLYDQASDFAVMSAIVNHDAPRVALAREEVPKALDEAISKALARNPTRRYASARQLQEALEQVAADIGQTPSAAALSDYMLSVFGSRPLPWEASAQPSAAGARAKKPAHRDLEPTRVANRAAPEPPVSRAGWAIGGAVAIAALLGVGAWQLSRPSTKAASVPRAAPSPRAQAPDPQSQRPDVAAAPPPARVPASPPEVVAGSPTPKRVPAEQPKPRRFPKKVGRAKPARPSPKAEQPTDPSPVPTATPKPFDPDGLGPVRTLRK